MGNRAKSTFYSVLFNNFHRRTALIAVLFSNFILLNFELNLNFEILSPKGFALKIYFKIQKQRPPMNYYLKKMCLDVFCSLLKHLVLRFVDTFFLKISTIID
jgi:hypothetical protein